MYPQRPCCLQDVCPLPGAIRWPLAPVGPPVIQSLVISHALLFSSHS